MIDNFFSKLRAIFDAEHISEEQMKRMFGAYRWRLVDNDPIPADITIKLLKDPRLRKYTLWLMSNKIAPISGQISPDLAHYGPIETIY